MTASLTHSRHRYTYDEYLAFERDSERKHVVVDAQFGIGLFRGGDEAVQPREPVRRQPAGIVEVAPHRRCNAFGQSPFARNKTWRCGPYSTLMLLYGGS